ncbi:MAG: YqhA family protein [Sulfuricella sp.]
MNDDKKTSRSGIEEWFETILFNSRFIVILAVISILCASVVMFLKGSMEVIQGISSYLPSFLSLQSNSQDDNILILSFVPALDNFLFATVLLIMSMGLYELFISKIDPKARTIGTRPDHWLVINNLDDLKARMGEVLLTILIVNFFKLSFSLVYSRPIDLLILGGAIAIISIVLFINHHAARMRKLSLTELVVPDSNGEETKI